MTKRILPVVLLCLAALTGVAQELALASGMRISRSVIVKNAVYKLDAAEPVIIVEGDGVTVDFNHAELKGGPGKMPDQFSGVAIWVRNGRNITIRNLKASGYKMALRAENADGLRIENCDFSYNYRPRLNSTQEKEDISDWMSYHHNEKDEWLRYGAAMYLRDCDSVHISNNRVTGGQNALMMTGCNDGLVIHNDFSFNSGIGLGMYRSSRNRVLLNRLIFNVRGYSHGVYNRGQDSAGILVYEQSSDNIFYRNNVTHGGDGFFLWAGQSTMDKGEGGCNNNLLQENDFSYAPTNGIEVTFSSNRITGNRIFECDHGIWGGYSYNTSITGNQFRDNRIGIAIEHGLHNEISGNLFSKDREAIRLWSRKQQPADWGYAQYRDTRSAGYLVATNSFNLHPLVFNLAGTDSIRLHNNSYSHCDKVFRMDSTVTHLDSTGEWDLVAGLDLPSLSLQSHEGFNPFEGAGKFAGRKHIRITEWGPYDFLSPIIWHTNPVSPSDTMHFELLGPKGSWAVKKTKGVRIVSRRQGGFPATLAAIREKGSRTDIEIELQYRGAALVTPFGEKLAAGRPYRFYFKKFFQPMDWEVAFFAMDTALYNPLREGGLFPPNVRLAPLKTEKAAELNYAWWGGLKIEGDRFPQFITLASAEPDIPPGDYELSVTWDDAVRVYMDDRLILDEWDPALYKFDESPNRKIPIRITGRHRFRVEHLELGGFATLAVKLYRK
jgi:parallel beta-helix repeat protein